MMKKISRIIFCLGIFLLSTRMISAQVLVYKIKFKDEKKSINYEFYDGGYFVSPSKSGVGSFLFTTSKDGARTYIEITDAGDLFYTLDNDSAKSVLRARSDSDGALSSLLAMGYVKSELKSSADENGKRVSSMVAKKLEGYFLASDSESDESFDPNVEDRGFAGISRVILNLDFTQSKNANQNSLSTDEVLTNLKTNLEAQGYTNEADTTTDTNTDTTSDTNNDTTADTTTDTNTDTTTDTNTDTTADTTTDTNTDTTTDTNTE